MSWNTTPLFKPIQDGGVAISASQANADTALATAGDANCLYCWTETGDNAVFVRIGASGGTAVVDDDFAILPGYVYYFSIGGGDTNIAAICATGETATLHAHVGYVY